MLRLNPNTLSWIIEISALVCDLFSSFLAVLWEPFWKNFLSRFNFLPTPL